MSELTQNLWRYIAIGVTALLLCAVSTGAYAHQHHHEHHKHHVAQPDASGGDKIALSADSKSGRKGHRHDPEHGRHHSGDCPLQTACECGELGCCGERYKGALTRSTILHKPIPALASAYKFVRWHLRQSAGLSELALSKRRYRRKHVELPAKDWRSLLHADSPRLRI